MSEQPGPVPDPFSGVIGRLPGPVAALSDRAQAMAELLVRWAEINSGSTHAAGLGRMADALMTSFQDAFPGAQIQALPLGADGAVRAISVHMRPGAPRQVLLSGHYDTVYAADHPFQTCTRVDAATLRGPGVADMKGGIVTMLEALRAFESEQPGTVGWQVLLTPDEETGSVLSAPLLREVAQRHRLALVFEPSRPNGNIVRARMGTGILTATSHGRAAHAGRAPEDGRNAIVALAEFLVAADQAARTIPGILLNIGAIRGGGTVNIVPDFAQAEMNFRVSRGAGEAELRRALEAAASRINARDGYRLEISGQLNRPPKEILPAEEPLFSAYRACAASVGAPVDWQDVAGGSDGNILSAAGLPCLDGLGPIGEHLHSSDEIVRLPSLVQRAQIAALFLRRLAL